MKTIAIFTRTLTTSTVSAFDLVRQGWQIVSIDIDGVITATKQQLVNCDKVGLVWNADARRADVWMNRPVITDISSVIPKEDEEYISQEDIDYDNACFDADMKDFEDLAQRY